MPRYLFRGQNPALLSVTMDSRQSAAEETDVGNGA
jgi:hypothetical protein